MTYWATTGGHSTSFEEAATDLWLADVINAYELVSTRRGAVLAGLL